MVQKTVLITGCSEGGIGDALAKAFHKKGLRVFASARNLTKVQHLKTMGLDIIQLDVTDEESIKQAVETVKGATGGTLDFLVNNSGGGYSMPLLDSEVSVAKKMFDVNVFAVVAVTQAFAPLLIASKGTIINIGSVAGHIPLPWQGYYNASKAAIGILTDQLRIEFSPWGVRAILVITGTIKTRFFDNLPEPPTLPHNSLYYPAKDIVEPTLAGTDLKKSAEDVDSYAETVVNNAVKSRPKQHLWIGGKAFSVWFASTFGWSTIWDALVPGLVNLPAITKKIRTADKTK
ncbi:putative short-chain dehydrogenase/reductase [Talaromyces proteolyticus]|uniref:Short-chain dehydrogenase/reductase n=1 Tax=Talaromyces proteolyticus TaxID=1131652 RepID=A0AAD4PVD7_9EURO|nr:putative short-chain dehydrogenase/reductase [Talaromyces proteolyticus]KAH8690178.1 putative short-chain dehydrogenase/reductase [Talaromyces proteolyticus]